jgi:hypothetical protein
MGKKLSVELEVIDKATKELNSIGRGFSSFQNRIVALGAAISGVFVGGSMVRGAIDAFKSLQNEAKEYTALNNQLRESLGYTSIALDREVEELSKKYVMEDRSILQAQQRLALYTQDEGMIIKLTQATIQYAAATGKNLLTAVDMVDKAIVNASGKMKGFPGTLDGAAESSDRLSSIVETLNGRMHGQAEAVAASKTMWDRLGITVSKAKETLAVGLFGKADDKELMRYKQAEEFNFNFFGNNSVYQKQYRAEYEDNIKIMEVFEKKQADLAAAAAKRADDAKREVNQGPMEHSVVPGFKSNADYDKAKLEELKKARAEEIKIEKQYRDLIDKDKDVYVEDQKKRLEEESRIDKQYRALIDEDKDAQLKVDKERIDEQESQWKESMRARWEYEKRIEEMKPQLYTNSAMGAIGALQKIGQASRANAQTMKRIEQGQALAGGAVAAIRALQNPVPILRWVDFAATIAATAAQVAIINNQSYATGTAGAPGGWSFVGERGPELINLPKGAQVLNASETKNNTTNNSGHTLVFNIRGQDGDVVDTLNMSIRKGTANVDRLLDLVTERMSRRG